MLWKVVSLENRRDSDRVVRLKVKRLQLSSSTINNHRWEPVSSLTGGRSFDDGVLRVGKSTVVGFEPRIVMPFAIVSITRRN